MNIIADVEQCKSFASKSIVMWYFSFAVATVLSGTIT
jgi:hypothetical protein